MTIKELFLVTKEFSIQNGTVPCGAIISIESINNSNNDCTVLIKPSLELYAIIDIVVYNRQ